MSNLTPIGSRLQIALDGEFLRMANEWFFRWHQIKTERGAEIESFNGAPIRLGGIHYSGSAVDVYWDTIQRYARQKVGAIFDGLERELPEYPVHVRRKALSEALSLTRQFIGKIRSQAVKKARILAGDGTRFPAVHDPGHWQGSTDTDIEARVETLIGIYCDLPAAGGEDAMALRSMLRDKVTLVKADGTVVKEEIQAQVSSGRVITFDVDLPLEPSDHFLRKQPSGVVEDYVVVEPNLLSGLGGIPASFQSKVRLSGQPAASAQVTIERITNHFHGDNARVTFGTDNSSNSKTELSGLQVAGLLEQVRPYLASLPEPQRSRIAAPVALLEDEIRSGKPDVGKMRGALESVRSIAQEATGNLIATGIAAMIGNTLSGGG